MNAQEYWKIFMETGAPEVYLLYNQAKRMETDHAFANPGVGSESILLQ